MNRGTLFAALLTLIGSATLVSCRRVADPRQLAAVDSLMHVMEAARLTLNELDTQRYAAADSILHLRRTLFLDRFNDTLTKPAAALLGDQFVQLREAARRSQDHRHVDQAVAESTTRLMRLKQDLNAAALGEEEIVQALKRERDTAAALEKSVLLVVTNHQLNERVLEQQAAVDSVLADPMPKRRIR